ncbi:transposase, partial [Clostridium sp. MCC353]|uniref:IS66 family transposase n=1 Tax=Clostridium sp. MCC353 TaxID=2592646 RepID=UPI001C036919
QERLEKRKKLIQPLLEDFWTWVEETSQKYTTNESLKRALQYSRNQKKYLNTFMEDGRLPLSNNECESCIRPFATGRKSWLFADSPEGAKASGIVYSLVETAKLNHLDVFQYLKYLLEQMPGLEYRYQNAPSMLDPYLPWSMELPESCRMKKKRR